MCLKLATFSSFLVAKGCWILGCVRFLFQKTLSKIHNITYLSKHYVSWVCCEMARVRNMPGLIYVIFKKDLRKVTPFLQASGIIKSERSYLIANIVHIFKEISTCCLSKITAIASNIKIWGYLVSSSKNTRRNMLLLFRISNFSVNIRIIWLLQVVCV